MADRTVRVRLEAAVAGYNAALSQAAANTRQQSAKIQGAIRSNADEFQTLGVAASAAGVLAAAGIASVLSSGANFQSGMQQVKAVSGATADEFGRLTDKARELGAETKFSATEAAEGMGFLAMAGFDATQTLDAMPGVLELAAAGAMDLGTAADIASNILTGFGLEAAEVGRVNDAMAATFTTTNTDLRQLGEAMKYVAPVAASAGVSLEETAAAIGLMGNAGIQGSMAGTSLRGAITRLLNPAADAARILERLGVNATDADGNLSSLDQIVQQLEQSGATTGEMMTIFGQRAGPAMAALVSQGADALRDQTTVALESAGTAAEIADVQMEGLKGSLTELGSAAEGLKIALFESGAGDVAEGVVDTITGMVRALEELPVPAQNAFMGVSGLAAVVGTVSGAALLAAPRIVATTDAVRALGGVSGMASKGLTGLVRFGLHPVTIALGLGLTAAGLFGKAKADARARVDEFSESLVASTGALTDDTRATVIARLEKEGLAEDAQTLGLNLQDVTDAVLGEGDAMERVTGQLWELHGGGEALGMNAVQLQARVESFADALGIEADALATAQQETRELAERTAEAEGTFLDAAHAAESGMTNAMYNLEAAHGEAARAARDDTDATLDFGDAAYDSAEGLDELESALESYLDTLKATTDPVFAVISAVDKVDEAQKAYTDTLADEEATQRDVENAAIDLARATAGLEAAAIDGNLSYGAFAMKLAEWVDQGVITATQAERIRDRVNEARGSAEDYAGGYEATLSADVDQPSLNRAISAIDYAARTRTVPLNLSVRGNANDQRFNNLEGARATGGPVWPGAWLVGEDGPEIVDLGRSGEVINAAATRQILAGPTSPPTTSSSPGGRGGTTLVHVEMPVMLDGRQVGSSEAMIDAVAGKVRSMSLQSAGAGPW